MPRHDRSAIPNAERRFPVRIRIAIPDDGFGRRLVAYHEWLWHNVGRDRFAIESDEAAPQGTFNLYLPSVQAAHAFVMAQLDRE